MEVPAAPVEVRVLEAVQGAIGTPQVVSVARGMSLFGEHAAGWLVFGALGALVDRRRRRDWVVATAAVAVAHGASVGVKRVVRRPRPDHDRVQVLVGTPSRLSFPSAHATSTTAAAVVFGALLRKPLVAALVLPMALSRMVLGVHYPTDVVAGSVLGATVAVVARRLFRKGNR
ncbi:phosphatase PAP2 family protein [Pseudonocardia sp. CNS-139]|nr:phosphatase PAP2 family protein [Pseudonocardia sp. CNS-139]